MKVESMRIQDVRPYEGNPRRNRTAVAKVAQSIEEFGFRQPVVVDEDSVIIAGHTRYQAAKRLKLKEVPVHVAKGLTPAQVRAYRLADNRTAEYASWDEGTLGDELKGLLDDGYDLTHTAFTGEELNSLLATDEIAENEDVIPEDVEPVCKDGEIWELGNHRLMCGDSTSSEDVAKLLDGVEPHLMVTDPPYGVEYDAEWRKRRGLQNNGAYGQVTNDDRADWSEAYDLFRGDVAYVWHASALTHVFAESLIKCGFSIRAQIIWAKNKIVPGRGDYHWQHEPCWYAVRTKGHWSGSRKESTVWSIDKPVKSETGHSTQKPVECMRRPILNNSSPGQAVYDPFLGSGTTMVAAELEGRHCYGMELNPEYCDIIIRRWELVSAGKAKRVFSPDV